MWQRRRGRIPDGGEFLRYALIITSKASNNEAEYEALIAELRITKEVGVTSLQVYCDSKLVVNPVKEDYVAKEITQRSQGFGRELFPI